MTLLATHDMCGFRYNGVKPRPTYKELISLVDCTLKYVDRAATLQSDSTVLIQLVRIRMLELEEEQCREMIERRRADMI